MTAATPTNDWDATKADEMIGLVMLIGLTYLDPSGEVEEQVQMFGHVTNADPRQGITVKLDGERDGELFVLPPDLEAIEPADPGTYRLRTTGEQVVDPDLLATFKITRPSDA